MSAFSFLNRCRVVLVCSLVGAGGQIICCSRRVIMEVWWNTSSAAKAESELNILHRLQLQYKSMFEGVVKRDQLAIRWQSTSLELASSAAASAENAVKQACVKLKC